MIAWKACLLAGGVYKAISTWDHPSDIAEVKHFFLAIYNVSVVGGAMYFFSLFGAQNPGTQMIMRVVGIFVSSTLPILIIMVPKFTIIQYKAITGKSLWAMSGRSSGSDKGSRGSQASQIEVVQTDTTKLQVRPRVSIHGPAWLTVLTPTPATRRLFFLPGRHPSGPCALAAPPSPRRRPNPRTRRQRRKAKHTPHARKTCTKTK